MTPYLLPFVLLATCVSGTSFRKSNDRQLEESLSYRIKKAIPLLQKSLNLIHHRYEHDTVMGSHLLHATSQMSPDSWELQKLIFMNKMVTKDAQYKMIFGGSSVTAGHDNGPRQSYVYIWEDLMRPTFEALGIDFIVNNIAQGANNCIPSDLCYESMGGEGADFISWEQSFNCGHDNNAFEATARWAVLERGYGSVYFAESGGVNPTTCPPATEKVPWSSPEWTPELENLPFWTATSEEVDKYKKAQAKFAPYAYTRFSGTTIDKYPKAKKQFAISGFSMWSPYQNPEFPDIADILPDKAKAKMAATPGHVLLACKLKAFTLEASVYGSASGKGARWHPSRAIHQFRGEMMTYLYGMVMLDSMFQLEKEIAASTESAVAARYADIRKNFGVATPADVPKALSCKYCQSKPLCYTDYRPHYNPKMLLSDAVVGKTDWITTTDSDFQAPDTSFVERRTGYHAKNGIADGEIHFRINVKAEMPQVMVCSYHVNNAITATEFTVDMNVPDARLEDYTPSNKRYPWTVRPEASVCGMLENLPAGQHVLSLTSKEGPKSTGAVSHLIMW